MQPPGNKAVISTTVKQELNDVDLKLETLVIKNKVPVDLNDGSEQSLLKL